MGTFSPLLSGNGNVYAEFDYGYQEGNRIWQPGEDGLRIVDADRGQVLFHTDTRWNADTYLNGICALRDNKHMLTAVYYAMGSQQYIFLLDIAEFYRKIQ